MECHYSSLAVNIEQSVEFVSHLPVPGLKLGKQEAAALTTKVLVQCATFCLCLFVCLFVCYGESKKINGCSAIKRVPAVSSSAH